MINGRRLCLCDLPIFSGIDKITFSKVCHVTNKIHKRKGEFLFYQGDPANTIYIIKDGSFKLVRTNKDGEETIIEIVGKGETIGETSLFRDNIFSPFSAIALEEARVCSIDSKSFEEIIKSEKTIALQIIKNLGNRLYDTWEQIADSNRQTVQEKVLSLLIKLAKEHGEHCDEGTIIKISLTQQDIASIIGASRVMVSQAIGELIDRNCISRDKRFYILKDKCF
jgi:CRP/FNR family transcriptional regulator